MPTRRRSNLSDARPPFLRRELGGAPYWFIIASVLALIGIGLFVLVKVL